MNVTVYYHAQLRQAAGLAHEVVAVAESTTVLALLQHLSKERPSLRRLLLDDHGAKQATILIFLGDNQTHGLQTLKENDEITLLTPVAGGSLFSEEERALYDWQRDVTGFGDEGQQRLKQARVFISRCGGVGGTVASYLAAAGVGKLRLAHAGNLRADDLNRQLLMTHAGIGSPRIDLAVKRLRELNPYVGIEGLAENVSEANIDRLMHGVDLVVSCAPLFAERLLMNRAAVSHGVPLIDCAMYELEVQLLTVLPGHSPCLACLYPEEPPAWQRRFPVFGVVAGTAGCLGAMEAIKLLAGIGEPHAGQMLLGNMGEMRFRKVTMSRRADCAVCGTLCQARV